MKLNIRPLIRTFAALFVVGALTQGIIAAAMPPKVGDSAPDFTLKTLDDKKVELKKLTAESPVVLVVLRGWPGYQCPICTRQVQDYIKQQEDFKDAQVLMVYPGPAEKLNEHAQEFSQNKEWPKNFTYVTDPDYVFTKAYGLRWDAPRETAYPSTFIIDQKNKVRFAKVSKEHGGRVSAAAALEALKEIK